MVKIEDGKLVGTEIIRRQFLHGSKDVGTYEVKIDFSGANLRHVIERAANDWVIAYRKRVKSVEQAQGLAKGVHFDVLLTKAEQTPDVASKALNVDEMSPEAAADLLRRLQATMEAKGIDVDETEESE